MTFEDRERLCRPEITSAQRRRPGEPSPKSSDGYTAEQAEPEGYRMSRVRMPHDYFECKLTDFAHQYDVHPERLAGDKNLVEYEDAHPFIVRP